METPFVFGKIASDNNFTDREKETDQLIFNFTSLVNTVLISPRRWGKSSLVIRAAELAKKKDKTLRFCFIDIYNIRSEEQFYQLLAQEILRVSSSKIEGLMDNAKRFIGRFIPRISFSPEYSGEFSLELDWQEVKKQPDDILNLAENIAKEKKLKFVICIDEFQNISGFEDPLALQKKMRSHWQKHQNVSYCLYGSKRNMLMEVFASPSMPFYKFGDIMFLQKIVKEEWIPFLKKRFSETGKKISDDNALLITDFAECHPYYVQQLAQQAWLRTEEECDNKIVATACESLVLQLSLLFQSLTDNLSNTQINFLKAILSDVAQLSSKKTLQEFCLGTSANVLRIKQALLKKEIVDIQGGVVSFLDPLYKYWLKSYYFKI